MLIRCCLEPSSGTSAENLVIHTSYTYIPAMSSMAAAAVSYSLPLPCSSLSLSISRRSEAAVRNRGSGCSTRPLVVCSVPVVRRRLSKSVSVSRWREFSGLRMNTEGLAKRSRDPQLQQQGEEVQDEAASKRSEVVKKSRNYVAATMSKPGVKSLLVAVAVPLILGSIDGFVNSPNTSWYFQLKKPWWQPPSFLFGTTWSILYPLMGLASWLVWAEGGFQAQGKPLTLYITQLILNLMWPVLFFGKQKLFLALIDILALCGTVFATIKSFQPVNHVAANLMKPYLAWVVFATVLNANLWYLNRNASSDSTSVTEQQPHAE